MFLFIDCLYQPLELTEESRSQHYSKVDVWYVKEADVKVADVKNGSTQTHRLIFTTNNLDQLLLPYFLLLLHCVMFHLLLEYL